ncbi:hypothetical protein JCM33374_g263 [Metschnikowia sp. JCM 33374]|nr:hypothetical protein JCM33374_g263 [Metschnikowia sp. JCM 33374]
MLDADISTPLSDVSMTEAVVSTPTLTSATIQENMELDTQLEPCETTQLQSNQRPQNLQRALIAVPKSRELARMESTEPSVKSSVRARVTKRNAPDSTTRPLLIQARIPAGLKNRSTPLVSKKPLQLTLLPTASDVNARALVLADKSLQPMTSDFHMEGMQVALRSKENAVAVAPASFPVGSPVSSRLRSRMALDSRYKRHIHPVDDREEVPAQHKVQKRGEFHNQLVASGGLYLLSHRTEEQVGDKDARSVEESVGGCYRIKKGLTDSEIDWTLTLYSMAKTERETVPHTFNQIEKLPMKLKWLEACDKEMRAHATNGTFKLVDLPEGRKAIGCRWVFAKKDNGVYKARLVALGNYQKHGIDYDITFSPVIRYTSLRLVLAIAARERLYVRQMDVTTAFLNGRLEEEIYMRQPSGYAVKGQEKKVLKLEKSLYGLKQAPQVWHKTVKAAIVEFKFQQCSAEPCLFFKRVKKGLVMIALYVDDMLLFAPDEKEIAKIQKLLCKRFEMKDLGVPTKFLGMNMRVTRNSIEISLEDYIEKMVSEFDDLPMRPTKAPISPSDKLHERKEDDVLCDETLYRSLIGRFLYAANLGRPDISFVTSHLSHFLIQPTKDHLKAAYKVLRYLKQTSTYSIRYCADEEDVVGYSDSDFAMWSDRKSRSGVLFKYSNSPVMWLSKMQSTIATSTLTAELGALYEATREAIWMKRLFEELQIPSKDVFTQLWCDNQGTISTVNNLGFHESVKHEEVKCAYVQEKIKQKKVKVEYVPTDQNVSDMLTKALQPDLLKKFIKMSGMIIHEKDA